MVLPCQLGTVRLTFSLPIKLGYKSKGSLITLVSDLAFIKGYWEDKATSGTQGFNTCQ